LRASVFTSTQAELQLVVPEGQANVQAPRLHTSLAPQTFPQAPQFLGSTRVSMHWFPLHIVSGALH
jgi:hypothetical protein